MSETPVRDNPYFRLPMEFDPLHYYGSGYILRQVLLTVSSPTMDDLELFAFPGMGKTTLLRYLAHPQGAFRQHADWLQAPFDRQPERILPVLVEFRQMPGGMRALDYLYLRFLEACRGPAVNAAARLKPLLEQLGRPEQVGAGQPETRLLPLDRDLALLRESGIRVVFLLDDFDLIFGSLTATETSNLRPLRRSAAFILCTERSLQAVNPEAAGSPFFQTITKVRMSGLSFPEAQDLLADPARRAGVTFPDADIDAVLRLTGQHLYLVLLAGRVLWDLRAALGLLEQPETALASAQLTLLQARLTAEFQPSFLIYMQRLEAVEKAALLRLARGDAPSPADIALFRSLEFKGLITLDGAQYRLFSPLFAQLLLQTPAREEARPTQPAVLRTRLTKTEQTLNAYLHAHAGRACTFEELWEAVWGKTYQDEDPRQVRRRIQVTLSRLREKLAQNGEDDILNVREVGYRVAGTP